MRRLLLITLCLVLAPALGAAPPPPTIAEAGASALDAFLQSSVARGDVPGVVALVVNRDRIVYHGAAGQLNVARGVAMPKDAIFRIASMTKPVTSVGTMMLVEQGKLALDDEVSKYLPAFANEKVITTVDERAGTYETRPARRAITIRHLLSHTSGIGYAWSNPKLAVAQKKTGLPEPELPLVHDPGEAWTYGASTRVLGDVVQKLTGQRIDAYLESRVLGPLGMNETAFEVPAAKRERVVTVHQKTGGVLNEQPNPEPLLVTVRGDGGLYSTAADYSKFVRMLLNRGELGGKRILSEASIRAMTTNQIGALVIEQQPTAEPLRSKPFPLGAGSDKWGLGFQLASPRANAPYVRSAGSYSWAGINNTHFWVDAEKGIGVIVLMQVLPFYDDQCIQLLRGFEDLVYRQLRSS